MSAEHADGLKMSGQRAVLVVLPSAMMVRNWLETPLAAKLGQTAGLSMTLVTPDEADATSAAAAQIGWRPLLRPRGASRSMRFRFAVGYLFHLMLVNRFNAIADFRGARERLKQSWSYRRTAIRDGMPASTLFGWPFARSKTIFAALHRLYWSGSQRNLDVENLFDALRPDLVVLGHLQTHFITPYVLAAMKRNTPILGVIGSWDHPTTKGPLAPGISHYLVQGDGIADELTRYHGVKRDQIETVGWVQFDPYCARRVSIPRVQQLAEFGLPPSSRYILLGAYPQRLGRHEPALCKRIAAFLASRMDCALVVRCHPLDRDWAARFGSLHNPPHLVVLPPELANLSRLADQVRHAELVLSSAGSILLDAIVLDTPAVAIAHEDNTESYYDRVARRYDMEHWAALLHSGGLPLARTDAELELLITETLADRNHNSTGRRQLIDRHLAPLDGRAADRIVAAIATAAGVVTTADPSRSAEVA